MRAGVRAVLLSPPTGDPFGFAKAATGRYRIGMFGTSIANNFNSSMRKFAQDAITAFGEAEHGNLFFGALGGSYEAAWQGWYKQPFGGPLLHRLRGQPSSTPLRITTYGDQIDLFWSREGDAVAFEVVIDGVSQGAIGGAGGQAYGQMTRFSVPLGPHDVVINPPASGYCYLERMESRNTASTGVEVVDATFGGSALQQAVTVRTATGAQVAGIAISGDNGVYAQADIPNLDLAVVSWLVNDAGVQAGPGGWVRGGAYADALTKLISRLRANGTKVIVIVEMAGHYIMPNDAGASNNYIAYNQAKADILMMAGAGVWVLDWDTPTRMSDIAAYAAAYYAVTGLNVAAGTYGGDFIHPNNAGYAQLDGQLTALTGVAIPNASDSGLETLKRWRINPARNQGQASVTVDGVAKTLTAISKPAVRSLAGWATRRDAVFVDATAVNGLADRQAAIDASGNSDAWGKYIDLGLTAAYWSGGAGTYLLTVRAAGNVILRLDGSTARMRIDGQLIPYTDPGNSRSVWSASFGAVEPVILTIEINASAGYFVVIQGRFYAISMVKSSRPVLAVA